MNYLVVTMIQLFRHIQILFLLFFNAVYICHNLTRKFLLIAVIASWHLSVQAEPIVKFQQPSFNKDIKNSIIWSIEQDTEGYLWFGTSEGIYRFDGYEFENIPLTDDDNKNIYSYRISSIFLDSFGKLWVATHENGLFFLNYGNFVRFNLGLPKITIKSIKESSDNSIWIGSNMGLFQINTKGVISHHPFKNNLTINAVVQKDSNSLLIGTNQGLWIFDTNSHLYTSLKNHAVLKNTAIYTIYKDPSNVVWIGADTGLYQLTKNQLFKHKIDNRIQSILSDGENIWAGSVYHGLFRMNKKTLNIEQYKFNKNSSNSLSDDNVFSLFISPDETLWIGTFHAGVNTLPINALSFETYIAAEESIHCSDSNVFYSFHVEDNVWWLGTESGLVRFDTKTSACQLLTHEEGSMNSLSHNVIISIDHASNGDLWISTGSQLNLLDPKTMEIDRLVGQVPQLGTYFSMEANNKILIGTEKGLYLFDPELKVSSPIFSQEILLNEAHFYAGRQDNLGNYYFATSSGIAFLNEDFVLKTFAKSHIPAKTVVQSIYVNTEHDGHIWAGTQNHGLYQISSTGELISILNETQEKSKNFIVQSIEKNDDNTFWLGTNTGLFHYYPAINQTNYFDLKDGLQGTIFLINASFRDKNGKLFFGGRNGFNAFNSNDVSRISLPPSIVLTRLNLFNKALKVGDTTHSGFKFDQPVNNIDLLELGHKDYVMDLEFSALDYTDSLRNQYAYRLLGFNDQWSYVDADNRRATYTNLSAGNYTFQVKGSNKDGVWSPTPKELKIKVHPAPWLSPWAYFAYFMTVVIAIWAYIRHKTFASQQRARELETTVKERTSMIESLLEHKNEVFANITHEFKTPLSLILGPVEQLSHKPELATHADELNMVKRNTRRLLLMVKQILQLSQAEVNREVIRESQALQPTLNMLYESFKPLTVNKNISLTLENNHEVNIYGTAECLELVVGNLLSNALKFTNTGGQIYITTDLKDEQVTISIKDTGTGIEEKDLSNIFKRFTRLNTHKSIQGTGIGLAVVKEITEANGGQVGVESQWGRGSTFTVNFPVTDIKLDSEMSQVMVDELVKNTENELEIYNNHSDSSLPRSKSKATVLIIEDNIDMRTHIGDVLKQRFNCLYAEHGRLGVAKALEELPDIVICDVMMPELDGYQVTRILRHDGRTSHIPIVLLTALNTKESRIKGWRENIDIYISKPFDGTELNIQLDNILSIRHLLQQQTSSAIKSNESLTSLGLPDQDLKFVEKFKKIIYNNYSNEYFQIADLASKMAVSERQLQRKLKALVNEKPMDMLRDFRLEKAALKLKEGFKVSVVSDQCGFSSFSYFCRCFKQKYGITAKQYQMLDKKRH